MGLKAIAITDHDSVSGIKEALSIGKKIGIEVVPGVELSTLYQGKELHLLGYYFDYQNKWFVDLLNHFSKAREERALKIIRILQKEGYEINLPEVRTIAKGNIGKPHLARVIIGNKRNKQRLREVFGVIPDLSGFINHYMVSGKIAYVPKEKLEITEGISYLHKLNGIPVLAHPGYDLPPSEENFKIISNFSNQGLKGLEAVYLVKSKSETRRCIDYYQKIASDLGMIITGGSDYHGEGEDIGANLGLIGTGFKVDYSILGVLKKEAGIGN